MEDCVSKDFSAFWSNREGQSVVVNITDEGVILDAYAIDFDGNDYLAGTMAMTYEEWFNFLEGR